MAYSSWINGNVAPQKRGSNVSCIHYKNNAYEIRLSHEQIEKAYWLDQTEIGRSKLRKLLLQNVFGLHETFSISLEALLDEVYSR